MAGVSSDNDDGLNVELNLVPFIDLLSVLVLFLLVTAVWMQIGAIPASVDSKGKSSNTMSEQTRLEIRITPRGYQLNWPPSITGLVGAMNKNAQGAYDLERLLKVLEMAVQQRKLNSVSVAADDMVDYGAVAQTIDIAKSAQITFVGLSTE